MTTLRKSVIAAIADKIESQHTSHPLRIAVDGRTASGKTTLADEIAEELRTRKRSVVRTSIDGFHRSRAERYLKGRFSPEGYLDDARDWSAVRRLLLDPLGPSGDLLYRTASFDLAKDQPLLQEPILASNNVILIVDGTFLQNSELKSAWDFVVFVDVAEAITLQRGVTRDSILLGGETRTREIYERRYLPAFEIYNARVAPLQNANLVVKNDHFDAPQLGSSTSAAAA